MNIKKSNFLTALGLANCKYEAKLCLMFVRFWLPCPPGSLLPNPSSFPLLVISHT